MWIRLPVAQPCRGLYNAVPVRNEDFTCPRRKIPALKLLEGRGFIKTRPNPDDARGKLVFVTDKGRRFREKAITSALNSFDHVLDAEQRRRMRALYDDLVTLRKYLDNNRL